MKHKAYGKAMLLGMFAIAGCYSYASDAINNENYHTVQASPNFIVQRVGDSDRVIVRLINDADNSAITTFAVSGVPAGIRVDSSCVVPNLTVEQQTAASCNGYYRPIFNSATDTLVPTGPGDAQQFFVVGLTPGQYTFTLTPTSVNMAVSRTVTVVVDAITLGPALSKSTAVAGDTVVLTAPTGSVFRTTSKVTFPTGGPVAIVGLSADSSKLTLIVNGGITGAASVTDVGLIANPGVQGVTLTTSNSLTTPALFAGTLSTTTAAIGATITITAPHNEVFAPTIPKDTLVVTFPAGPPPIILGLSSDSTTISLVVMPGDTGAAIVNHVRIQNAPVLGNQTFRTNSSLQVPAVPTTLSSGAPALDVPVTVAIGGGLRFGTDSKVFFGNTPTAIISTSADSSTVVVFPFVGVAGGTVTFDSLHTSLTTFPIAGPGDKSITLQAPSLDPNASALATAPTITLAPPGGSITVTRLGSSLQNAPAGNAAQCGGTTGDGCMLYKVVVAAPTTIDVTLAWTPGPDMGVYLLDSGGNALGAIADNGGQGTSGEPETGTQTLAPGTYYLAVVYFGTGSGYSSSGNTVPPIFWGLLITTH